MKSFRRCSIKRGSISSSELTDAVMTEDDYSSFSDSLSHVECIPGYFLENELRVLKDLVSSLKESHSKVRVFHDEGGTMRIKGGISQLVQIYGKAGTGKTTLVMEKLQKYILQHPQDQPLCFFASCHFGRTNKKPYSHIASFLQDLCELYLTKRRPNSEKQAEIRDALGPDFIQELTRLVPSLHQIAGGRSQNKLHVHPRTHNISTAVHKLLLALSKEQVLVLFFDDLQHADDASLDLLRVLFQDTLFSSSIMYITSTTDDTISNNWLNDSLTNRRHRRFLPITMLHLSNLATHQKVKDFVVASDLLLSHGGNDQDDVVLDDDDHRIVAAIADLAFPRTQGNVSICFANVFCAKLFLLTAAALTSVFSLSQPYLIVETIKSWMANGWLRRNFADQKWILDESKIDAAKKENSNHNPPILLNIAAKPESTEIYDYYYKGKIANLQPSPKLCAVLTLFSFIGPSSSMATIESVLLLCQQHVQKVKDEQLAKALADIQTDEIRGLLESAVKEGLLLQDDDDDTLFRFVHDAIKDAFRADHATDVRDVLWFMIGKHFSNINDSFLAARYLNLIKGENFSLDIELALRQNRLAALEAVSLGSYAYALEFINTARELLLNRTDPWKTQKNLTLEIFNVSAEMHLADGNLTVAKEMADAIVSNTSKGSSARALFVLVQVLYAQGRTGQAASTGVSWLQEMGETSISTKSPSLPNVKMQMYKTKRMMKGIRNDDILSLAPMADENMKSIVRMISLLSLRSVLTGGSSVFIVGFLRLMQLTLTHGLSGQAALSTAMAGIILRIMHDDYMEGYRLGSLAVDMMDRLDVQENKSYVMWVASAGLLHLEETLQNCEGPVLSSFEGSLVTGDYNLALVSGCQYASILFNSGLNLEIVTQEMRSIDRGLVDHFKEEDSRINGVSPFWQCALNLMGYSMSTPFRLKGEIMNEKSLLVEAQRRKDPLLAIAVCHVQMQLACYFSKWDLAKENMKKAMNIASSAPRILETFHCYYIFNFWCGMINFELARQANNNKKRKYATRARKSFKMMQTHEKIGCPNTFPFLLLLGAENIALKSKNSQTVQVAYDKAIKASEALPNIGGFAQERAAITLGRREESTKASSYMRQAIETYRRWGASELSDELRSKFSKIMRNESNARDEVISRNSSAASTEKTRKVSNARRRMIRTLNVDVLNNPNML